MSIFKDYIIQEVNPLDLVASLGEDFSCDAFDCWGGNNRSPADLITDKIEDSFGARENEYLIDMMEQGMQKYPVVIGVNGWSEYGEGEDWILGNGNHRLAIAVGLMLDTLLVVFQEDPDDFMLADISTELGY